MATHQNITSYQVIDTFHSDLTALAADCGIDFNKLLERIRFDGVAIRKGIELDKKHRGKVWAIASEWTAPNGDRYPTITFKTFKGGGYSETWNGYNAWRERADYAAIPKAYRPKKPNPVAVVDKTEQERQRKINRFSAFRELFEQLPKLSADNFEGCNLAAKGFVFDDLPDNLDIRRGADSRGQFIAYPLRNGQSQTVGYQSIHDAEFIDYEGNARAKDFYFYPDSYSGSYAWLGEPPKDKNSLVRHGEGLASCLTAHIASGLPVVICLNTTNTPHVVKELTKQGYTNLQAIADNDITDNDNGNAGVFWAIKAARYVSDKIIVPELDGKKCDIDDVRQALGMDAVRDQLETNTLDIPKNPLEYHKLLAKYAPKKQLDGVIASCCYFAAQRITTPKQLRIQTKAIAALRNKRPETIISKELHQQANAIAALRYGSPTAICKLIKRFFKKRLDALKYDNTITDFDGITRHDCDSIKKDNEKILELILEIGEGIILDYRSMGTGKTNLMRLIARYFKGKARTAYIAHRVALTKSASERLDIHHYQSGKSSFESVAICVDSIISYDLGGVSVLFLDEIRQVLEHVLHAKTVKNRTAVYNQLVRLIQDADLVICADADLNQFTVDWLKSIANKPIHAIDTTPEKTDKTIHALADDSESIYSALQAIEEGENVWIATDSTQQAYKLLAALERTGLSEHDSDVLFLHRKNKGDAKQAAFLLNPDKESQKYRVVIHTPVISSGVSIENNHFHAVYALFRNVIAPNEMLQTIARVRAVKDIYVSFKANHAKNRPTDKQDLLDGEIAKRQRFEPFIPRINEKTNAIALTDFDIMRLNHIVAKNKALNDYKATFLLLAQMKGYAIGETIAAIDAKNQPVIKGLGKDATEKQCNQITTADDTDSDQAKAIEKNPNPTQAQSNALDKYKTVEMTGKTSDKITQDDAKFYLQGGMKIVANHELIHADINELKQRDRDNLITRDRWSSLTGKHCFLKVVIEGLLGKRITQTVARQSCEFLQQFHKELAANEMGNFKTISKYPIRQLSDFVKQCGYELLEQKDSKGNRDYILQVNPQVLEYVKNRTAHAKSVVNKNVSCAVA